MRAEYFIFPELFMRRRTSVNAAPGTVTATPPARLTCPSATKEQKGQAPERPRLPRFEGRGAKGELRISAPKLEGLLDVAERVVSRRSVLAVAGLVRIESGDARIRAYATDLQAWAWVDIREPLNAGVEGTFLLDPPALRRLLRTGSQAFRFSLEEAGRIEVECAAGGETRRRETMENGDLKEFPSTHKPPCLAGAVPGLGLALYEASRFVSKESARYSLTGIRIQGRDVVASDGKRLYRRALTGLDAGSGVTAPMSRVFASRKLMLGEALSVGINKNTVAIGSSWWTLSLPPIEGNFPDYRSVIPPEPANRWKLTPRDVEFLKQTLPTLPFDRRDPAIQLVFEAGREGCQVRLTGPAGGSGGAVLDRIAYQGACGTLRLNPVFLFDAAGVSGIDRLGWGDPASAVRLDGRGVVVLVMPHAPSGAAPRRQ